MSATQHRRDRRRLDALPPIVDGATWQAVVDRVEIEALRGDFTDAVMMPDYDRVASLSTQDGAVRMPHIATEAVSREEILRDLWGLRTVRGIFGAYDGSLTVRAGDAAGELLIEARSLDTGNNRRDQHLRSPAFFDVERHPRIVFTTTAAAARDGGVTVTGVLAIGSSSVRLEIPAKVEHLADGALRLEGRTTLGRHAAGLAWNKRG